MRNGIAGLSLLVILAGCSGGDEGPTPQSAPQSSEQVAPDQPTQPAADQIKPETVIRFKNGTFACMNRDDLQELLTHAMKGEATKANAMAIENGGSCFQIPPTEKVRVISVDYADPGAQVGLLEVVGATNQSANGAWSMSVGAEPVK